jgi:adenylyltransferase/sulfurtransferase
LTRYSRHLLVPELGRVGQDRLKAGRVLIVGVGGLGCPAAMYLAAAGVGTLGLVEFDRVDETNLHRQLLYSNSDVGRPKIDRAVERLAEINPHVRIEPHPVRFQAENARELVARYDLVLDGSDNFGTRYLVNDACVMLRKPNVHGAVHRFEGQVSVYAAAGGPCYRCLFPTPPAPGEVPNCAEAGVLGVLPGLVGLLQATETVKLLAGVGAPMVGRLLVLDALAMKFREIRLKPDPQCPVCGDCPTITQLADYDAPCETNTPGGPDPMSADSMPQMTPEELKARLDRGDDLFILDVRNPDEYAICNIAGSTLIPLGELPARLNELDPQREIVVHCKMGGRSAQAQAFLKQNGFANVHNLAGGILAWAERIDPAMPKY